MPEHLIEKKSKKVAKSRYIKPNGEFKEMTCPDNPKESNKFCGCVRYQMAMGKSKDSAERICGYIKKKKYENIELEIPSILLEDKQLHAVLQNESKLLELVVAKCKQMVGEDSDKFEECVYLGMLMHKNAK